MPIGRRCSSAICPSSPAARASRAKPRSSSTGRPRSASAAPQTPAPLSGSLRPSTCSCTRPMASNSRRCGPRSPSSSAISISTGVRGSVTLCTGCPSPGTKRPSARVRRTAVQRQRVPAGLVGGQRGRRGLLPLQHLVQVTPAVLGDPEEPGPAAEQPGGQRPLQRVRGRQVGQPRGDRGRGEPVVGQRHQHGLEHPGLRRRRPAQRDQPEGELSEADLAHQVGRQVLAEQPDLVGGRGAE